MVRMNSEDVPLKLIELPDETKRAAMRTVATRMEARGHTATWNVLEMLGLVDPKEKPLTKEQHKHRNRMEKLWASRREEVDNSED